MEEARANFCMTKSSSAEAIVGSIVVRLRVSLPPIVSLMYVLFADRLVGRTEFDFCGEILDTTEPVIRLTTATVPKMYQQ